MKVHIGSNTYSSLVVVLSHGEVTSTATTHVVWIKRFLNDLDLNLIDGPVGIFCDNQAGISLINSGVNSLREKHIKIQYYYIRDII